MTQPLETVLSVLDDVRESSIVLVDDDGDDVRESLRTAIKERDQLLHNLKLANIGLLREAREAITDTADTLALLESDPAFMKKQIDWDKKTIAQLREVEAKLREATK